MHICFCASDIVGEDNAVMGMSHFLYLYLYLRIFCISILVRH